MLQASGAGHGAVLAEARRGVGVEQLDLSGSELERVGGARMAPTPSLPD